MDGFPSNLNDTFTSTRGCAEPMVNMYIILYFYMLYCLAYFIIFVYFIAMHFFTLTLVHMYERLKPTMNSLLACL